MIDGRPHPFDDNRCVTYILFEDAGKFGAGRLMSETDTALQVELDSGKRVKVKAAHALLRFAAPAPAQFLQNVERLSLDIDPDLAWEFAPDSDFGFADLAREYFNANADVTQQAATLMGLQRSPHYFRRLGKGLFRKASADIVQAALAGIEKKRLTLLQIEAWADALVNGTTPAPIQDQIYKILFKPDKNAPEYKAVVEASRRAKQAPLDLLRVAGAIDNPYQFHWRRFVFDCFPRGVAHASLSAPTVTDPLPTAAVQAFSIDDSATTEIDDALSVQGLGSPEVTLGIHIAAPGLALLPGSALDKVAAERLSTVYIPGWKVTMLPDAVVQQYTLQAGQDVPAVSLYVRIDPVTLAVRSTETRLERVPIAANLRHDQLDGIVTEAALNDPASADFAFAHELAFAHRLAQHLKAQREVVRGKPENFTRPDPVYRLERDGADAHGAPSGTEGIEIGFRQRGAPLDLIVAEAMILANSTWGEWLAALKVPGIYRSQASMAPGVKVRMGTKPAPHAGLGVAYYTWATSPLRRYVDLVNQWQIIACARHGATAALAAPFKARDASLLSIVSMFESAYADYAEVQRRLERYWTLRWLQQQAVHELDAVMVQDGLARAVVVPLVFRLHGSAQVPRGARVRARITGIDELALDLQANLIARLDAPAASETDEARAADEAAADDDEALADDAAPLKLAIDVDESSGDADASAHQTGIEANDNSSPIAS